MKFIAKVMNQAKQKGEIEINAKNKKLAISNLKKQGYLILELKESLNDIKDLENGSKEDFSVKSEFRNFDSPSIWTEKYIKSMKYFITILCIISIIINFNFSGPSTKQDLYKTVSKELKPKKKIAYKKPPPIDERNKKWQIKTGKYNKNSPEMSRQVTQDVLKFKSWDDFDRYSQKHPNR